MIDELVRNHQISLRLSDQHLGSYPGFGQKLNETASIRNRSAIIDGLVLNKKGFETLPSRLFSGWGTVRFIDLEGGFYGIVTSSGERFIPDNLPRALLADGITIRFSGMIGNEEPGIAMWGRTIHLISSEKIDRSFSKEGTIQYIDLEGGFYGISTVNGEKYLPMNLAPEFRVDGLPVAFTARERQDISTTAMWGIPVEITSIRMIGQQQSPIPGSWTLISFSDGSAWHTLLPGTEITASFSDGGKLSGSAGCNRYFAAYETTGVSLAIGGIGSTEMYCEGTMNQEMTYLRLLSTAWAFRVEEGALSISDQSGQEILRYHAANAETGEKGVKRIEFSRTGGYAGCSDHLVLYENGSARVTRKEYTTVVQVTDDTRNCLDSLLAKVDFSTLWDEYSAPPGGADLFSYTVTYEGRTVHLEETAVPEDLLPVIDLLCDIIMTSAPDDIAPPLHP
jgi:heat shock protein HslJ